MSILKTLNQEQWSTLASNASIDELADLLNCSARSVQNHLKKHNIQVKPARKRGRPHGTKKITEAIPERPEPQGLGLGSDWAGEFRHLLTPETRARLEAWEQGSQA